MLRSVGAQLGEIDRSRARFFNACTAGEVMIRSTVRDWDPSECGTCLRRRLHNLLDGNLAAAFSLLGKIGGSQISCFPPARIFRSRDAGVLPAYLAFSLKRHSIESFPLVKEASYAEESTPEDFTARVHARVGVYGRRHSGRCCCERCGADGGPPAEDEAPAAEEAAAEPAAAPSKYNEVARTMLAEMVANGELPPVDEVHGSTRALDPLVITPEEEIGDYGGVWNRLATSASDNQLGGKVGGARSAVNISYATTKTVPRSTQTSLRAGRYRLTAQPSHFTCARG